jgi:thymidylate synthase
VYLDLCEKLLAAKQVAGTREINNVKVSFDASKNTIVGVRGSSPAYLLGEWLWYFNGINHMNFISKYGSMWKRLTDDGITNNSAYGYIMQYKFGFNQIEKMIELLQKDPTSRRAVININTPNERVIETHDEPCTIGLQYLIRDGKLNCTGIMRSNDVWFGFPYDVAFFTELQRYIASRLNIRVGTYTHFVVSMHLYDKDYDAIQKIVQNRESECYEYDSKLLYEYSRYMADEIIKDIMRDRDAKWIKDHTMLMAEQLIKFRKVEC